MVALHGIPGSVRDFRHLAPQLGEAVRFIGLQMRAIGAVDCARFRRAVARGLPKTLLAYAADDPMIEAEVSAELGLAIPHARVLAFEDGGHNIQKTRAREIAAAIRQLLASDLDQAPPQA